MCDKFWSRRSTGPYKFYLLSTCWNVQINFNENAYLIVPGRYTEFVALDLAASYFFYPMGISLFSGIKGTFYFDNEYKLLTRFSVSNAFWMLLGWIYYYFGLSIIFFVRTFKNLLHQLIQKVIWLYFMFVSYLL